MLPLRKESINLVKNVEFNYVLQLRLYSGLVFKKNFFYDLCLKGPWPSIVFFLKGLYTSVGD